MLLSAALAFLALAPSAVHSQDACRNIVQAAAEDVRLAAMRAAMRASGLEDMFATTNMTFTFLAPTNSAFWSPDVQSRIALMPFNATDPDLSLSLLLRGHVLLGAFPSEALSSGKTFKTLAGVSVGVIVTPGGITRMVGGQDNAVVTEANAVPRLCGGSLVHFVDNLMSPDVSEWQCCSVLQGVQLLGPAHETGQRYQKCIDEGDDMSEQVKGSAFTVFAPVDEAWQRVKDVTANQYEGILEYHVVPGALTRKALSHTTTLTTLKGETLTVQTSGGTITIGREGSTATVLPPQDSSTAPLQLCGGSQVHLINNVLLPQTFDTCTPLPAAVGNIPDIAHLTQTFSSAQFTDMLRSDQGYTLLVPNETVVQQIRAHPASLGVTVAQLTTAHIVVGAYRFEQLQLMNGQTVPTLNSTLKVIVSSQGQVSFRSTAGDEAAITTYNIQGDVQASPFGKICGNSIAHLLNGVLRPAVPGMQLPPLPSSKSAPIHIPALSIILVALAALLLHLPHAS